MRLWSCSKAAIEKARGGREWGNFFRGLVVAVSIAMVHCPKCGNACIILYVIMLTVFVGAVLLYPYYATIIPPIATNKWLYRI
jgi:hypothetical protein